MHPSQEFHITEPEDFKNKLLNWANRFSIFCFLDRNKYYPEENYFDFCLAAGVQTRLHPEEVNLNQPPPNWVFGHLNFEYFDPPALPPGEPWIDFGAGFFFEPEHLLQVSGDCLCISSYSRDPRSLFEEIISVSPFSERETNQCHFQHGISREEYLSRINGLLAHIQRGDCYEINFCQHFFAEEVSINPVRIFALLNQLSPNPFATLYRHQHKYCICASPERFLQKKGSFLQAQPIKGTIGRSADPAEDANLKNILAHSLKDSTENVMTVDLVRNDLSMVCEEGSVSVPSLCAIESFPKVHHMVSTVVGSVSTAVKFLDIMQACFPMGSMTGAPKKRVLELIKEFEKEPRGLFSGTIGFITATGDFDFNVVIRSLLYDDEKKIISLKTGGGITAASIAEEEYEESLLKASSAMQVLK